MLSLFYVTPFLCLVSAWPTVVEINSILQRNNARLNTGVAHPNPSFDAEAQHVQVAPGSKHEFRPPGHGDLRGECPGLNAAANHGFLPRNGRPTILDAISGLEEAYNMSPALAGTLAAIAVLLSGDIPSLTWSIGGEFPSTLPLVLGSPKGLLGTHNKYEGDASMTRGDAHLNNGRVNVFNMQSWNAIMSLIGDDLTLDKVAQLSSANTRYSIGNNPYYFSGPVSGIVAPAAYNFAVNFMSNHSAQVPGGFLSPEVLKSFFAVTGQDGNYVHHWGQERIPENWYRRPGGKDQYGTVSAVLDILSSAKDYPDILRIGGNTGTTNSFTGVDLANLTNGVYNGATLLEGNNLICFAYQAAMAGGIDELGGVLGAIGKLIDPVLKPIRSEVADLQCPQLKEMNSQLFNVFPGYKGK